MTPQLKLMLISTTPDQSAVGLILDEIAFTAPSSPELLARITMTANRIALCVNTHAQQTPQEIMQSGQHIFLKGVEHGIDEAFKALGSNRGPGIDAAKLSILNQVRMDMAEQEPS